jgi:hypothetical protein
LRGNICDVKVGISRSRSEFLSDLSNPRDVADRKDNQQLVTNRIHATEGESDESSPFASVCHGSFEFIGTETSEKSGFADRQANQAVPREAASGGVKLANRLVRRGSSR